MYLKSLILKGFKSFADRSVIDFEPGISAIVGPNGSGKSNISEAVLWVLGERKTSNLRVHSMEELIFSGSSARPAAKVAEVELVLDNSDGTIPVEFTEVVITRRMHHNGESEYFINGSPCLRRDIIDILHDSGIGEGVHSVITQGNLTAMIESRPVDRKAILEEAAGVAKHKARKAKASRQIAKMDDTLSRIRDVQKVIESQLRPLERQASRAQRYEEYASELRDITLALAVDDLRTLQEQWNEIDLKEKEIDAEAELIKFRLEERDAEVTKKQLVLEQKGLFVGDLNEQRSRCQSIMNRLEANMRLIEEKGKNMVLRLSELRATIHTSERRLNEALAEQRSISTESDDIDARLRALYSTFNELTRTSEQVTKEKRQIEDEHNSLAAKLRGSESALVMTRDNLARVQSSLESLDVEEQLLQERHDQVIAELSEAQTALATHRQKREQLEGERQKAQNDLDLAHSDTDKRVRLLDQAKREMDAQRSRFNDIQAEIRAIEEIERAFENASPSISWIQSHQSEFSGIVGSLSQVFSAPPEFEPLLERLLGSDISGLLTADMKSANLIAQRLIGSGGEASEISFMPLDGMRASELPASPDGRRLLDLISYDESYSEIAKALIGDVYIADSLGEAVEFHSRDKIGVRFATTDGAVVWANGKITLGKQISDFEGVLARKRKLNKLNESNEECSLRLSEAEMAVSEAERALDLAKQDGFELSSVLAKLSAECDLGDSQIKQYESQALQLTNSRAELDRKLKSVEVRRAQAAPLAAEYEVRIQTLEKDIESMRDSVEESSRKLLDITNERAETIDRLTEIKLQMETAKSTVEYRQRRAERLVAEIASLREALEVSRQTEESLSIIRLRVDPLHRIFEELYEGIGAWAAKLQEQAKLTQSDSKSLREVIESAKRARDEARAESERLAAQLNEIKVEKAKIETEVNHAVARIKEETGVSLETALKTPSPVNRAQDEAQAEKLRRKISSLGAVNHVAKEEYEALKARRDYIEGQVADLQEARKKLNTISRALDRRMNKQYQLTFDAVNASFKALYERLSPGDTGELVMLDATDDEPAGVEIVIHPHGMKLTNLSLLSGGQSAIVALSFLFAIYMTRNAPFYILDEVEPSLDGTNLARVCELLESMRETTQLIMVTHQRQTMEIADILYGVSKQASGVSKLVSQRLEQALKDLDEEEANAKVEG
ncbi:MAG: chromosome segregation protein SMC [bacterium]|nr:chromosome segregation protein SMC [bacterium]